ncbi:TniQ family protein [Amycolatopsis samaneae]|uniref:TniQ family protein n=1 Tax=Amycolatopsis samaneae TaxID=664691 RepID=A0ABW5GN56_9PSEU
MTTLRPLPRSLDPLPDESIIGYVLRLGHRLGLAPDRVADITGLISGHSRDRMALAKMLTTIDHASMAAFTTATRLTAHEARQLFLEPLMVRYPPAVWATWTKYRAHTQFGSWVFTRSTRYCPQCLTGNDTAIQRDHGGAWRRSWRLPIVFACTTHKRLLEHACPRCATPAHHRSQAYLQRWSSAELHPAQCRATSHRTARPCGAWLTDPRRSSSPLAPHLRRLQDKLVALLNGKPPGIPTSPGETQREPSIYFLDLAMTTYLIRATWPVSGQLLRNTEEIAIVDDVLGPADGRLQSNYPGRTNPAPRRAMSKLHRLHCTPPLETLPCALLLSAADELLQHDSTEQLVARFRPIAAVAEDKLDVVTGHARFLCSPRLVDAIAEIRNLPTRRSATPSAISSLGTGHSARE